MPMRIAKKKKELSVTSLHWCVTGNDFWREYKTDDAQKTLRALWDRNADRIKALCSPIMPRAAALFDGEQPGARAHWSMDDSRKLLEQLEA